MGDLCRHHLTPVGDGELVLVAGPTWSMGLRLGSVAVHFMVKHVGIHPLQ